MNNSKTFQELQNDVNEYASDCYDNLSQLKSLELNPNKILSFQSGENNLFGTEVKQFSKMNDWAFSQLANRLNAPSMSWLGNDKYCDDPLRVKIINELVEDREDARLMLRAKGEMLRAVLTDQYTPFDNKALIDLIGNAIQEMGVEPQVFRPDVGDELRTYILLPNITFGNLPSGNNPGNGGLHPAIYIGNSEIGTSSARIAGGVYRKTCDNGTIYGWNADDVFAIRHRWISTNAMAVLVSEAVGIAFKMSEEAALKFIASQEKHLQPKSLKPIINDWATKYGISVEAKENWLATVTSESQTYGRLDDPRAFDLINAATYVAQARPAAEREMMERMAGDLLSVETFVTLGG